MLRGIPDIIGSDLLKALADTGHGDTVRRRNGTVAPERRRGHEPRQRNRTASLTKKRPPGNLHIVLSIQDHLVLSAAYDTKIAPSRQDPKSPLTYFAFGLTRIRGGGYHSGRRRRSVPNIP